MSLPCSPKVNIYIYFYLSIVSILAAFRNIVTKKNMRFLPLKIEVGKMWNKKRDVSFCFKTRLRITERESGREEEREREKHTHTHTHR